MAAYPRFPRVVDDVTIRLIATAVLVVAVTALALNQWWIYAVLALDFTLRTAFGPSASPIAQAVIRVVPAEICLECADISLRQRSLPSTA